MTRAEWKALDQEYRILVRLWLDTMLKSTKKADAIWDATIKNDRFKAMVRSRGDIDLLRQREKGYFELKKGRPYTTFAKVDLP
jgi:hypothetical protein